MRSFRKMLAAQYVSSDTNAALANSARTTGWTVVADAQPRSIVVFQPGVYGAHATQGHVAWVDAVNGQNVTITEMNGAAGFNAWSSRTIRDIPGMSYILLP